MRESLVIVAFLIGSACKDLQSLVYGTGVLVFYWTSALRTIQLEVLLIPTLSLQVFIYNAVHILGLSGLADSLLVAH